MKPILIFILISIQSICYSQIDTSYIKNSINRIESENKKLYQKIEDISKSTELLCISENTFEVVKQNKKKMDFAIFKNAKQYTAIIYDEDSIENCCDELIKINPKHRVVIYVFSCIAGGLLVHWHIHTAVFNNLLNPLFGNYFGSFMYGVFFLLFNGLLGYILLKRKIYIKL